MNAIVANYGNFTNYTSYITMRMRSSVSWLYEDDYLCSVTILLLSILLVMSTFIMLLT